MELLEKLGAFGIGILLAVSVAGLFWKLDDAIAEAPRQALSRFLQRLSIEPPYPNLPEIVADAFDRIFGEKHLSWRCFRMSCLFSALAVAVLWVVYSQANPGAFVAHVENFLGIAFFASMLNLIPDYISLMETRIVVRLMGRKQKSLAMFGYVGMDFLLTLLIFITVAGVFYAIFEALLFYGSTGEWAFRGVPIIDYIEALVYLFMNKDTLALSGSQRGMLGIFLYSTFFTSVWVWLTALGWGAIRLLAMAPPVLQAMQYLLPVKVRPLRSIGEVAAVIVCIGYWGYSAATWITSTPEAQAAVGN